MGKADRAEDPIRGPRPRLCEPREAGDQAYPLPHHPHRPTGRQHRRPHRAVRLEAFVTNAVQKRLSLTDAVLCYRNEYRVERIFNRLKSRLHIAPMFVKLNEQIEGLTHLLTLGVRVLTIMEFVLRRSLQNDQATLPGFAPGKQEKDDRQANSGAHPESVSAVSLTIVKNAAGAEIMRRLTPLSGLQEDILQRQGWYFSLRTA